MTLMRQRAYRIYTLLLLAALTGFAGGGLTRRVVSKSSGSQVDEPALAAAQEENLAPAAALQVNADVPSSSAASGTITNSDSAVAASAVPLASAHAGLSALHDLNGSADASTLRTVAAHSTEVPRLGATVPTKAVQAGAPKLNTPKVKVLPPEPSEPVSDLQKADESAPSPSDTTNPL